MTRREIAGWLCRNVQKKRLERIGEPVPVPLHPDPLDGLPAAEQQNWLDMAEAVLELSDANQPIVRLEALAGDWLRYTTLLGGHDPEWCDEMRRTVVIEMRNEVEKLAKECGL